MGILQTKTYTDMHVRLITAQVRDLTREAVHVNIISVLSDNVIDLDVTMYDSRDDSNRYHDVAVVLKVCDVYTF